MDENPNVMFELGCVMAIPDERPKVLLRQKGSKPAPADVRHWLFIDYELPREETEAIVRASSEELQRKLLAHHEFMKLRQEATTHYLASVFLQEIPARLEKREAERIS